MTEGAPNWVRPLFTRDFHLSHNKSARQCVYILLMIKEDTDSPIYSIEEDAPLYSLEDNSADDLAVYPKTEDDEEDDEEDDDAVEDDDETESEEEVAEKGHSPSGVLLKTMLTPVEGWKELKRARFKTEDFAAGCFYPLAALAAVSECASLFFEANKSISDWAMDGLATFITFFFGYFTILAAGSVILPKKSRDFLKKDIGKQFVMLNLSTLAIFWVFIQAIPMIEPVLVFLPIWTIYLIFKGVRVLRIPSEVENSTTGYLCMFMIGIPVLWNWIMTEFLLPAV